MRCLRDSGEDAEEVMDRLMTYDGMRGIFRLMVEREAAERDGYSYIAPWWLFDRSVSRTALLEKILAELKQV